MPPKKQKLELAWIGKENRPRLEPRILIPDDSKSYHAKYRVKDGIEHSLWLSLIRPRMELIHKTLSGGSL